MKRIYYRALMMLVVFGLGGSAYGMTGGGHDGEFCGANNWSKSEKVSHNELRELNVPGGRLKVDSENGRITVKGEDRGDVLVRACVRTWGENEADAKMRAGAVRIDTSDGVRAVNTPDRDWSVSYEILVPRLTDLDLSAGNGRITISSVQGQMNVKTGNGRITLEDVAGGIRGRTGNGRVTVSLSGFAYQGGGIDVETGNGRITLKLPENYSANVDVETSNGRFSSDFDELQVAAAAFKEKRKSGPKRVSASINGGGAPIRLQTTNGRVSIHKISAKEVVPE